MVSIAFFSGERNSVGTDSLLIFDLDVVMTAAIKFFAMDISDVIKGLRVRIFSLFLVS